MSQVELIIEQLEAEGHEFDCGRHVSIAAKRICGDNEDEGAIRANAS